MQVYLCFDVEDLVHPASDDIVLDIARVLTAESLTGSFCVVGEKARLWERRGRGDVIEAVARHDVGLHTDRHSIHPTVSEYLCDKQWEEGVDEAVRRETPGARDLERIFGTRPSTWGTSGSSWAPQIPAATRRMGIPSNIYSHAQAGDRAAAWFAGQLCFSRVAALPATEDTLCDDAAFEAALPRLIRDLADAARQGHRCMGLFCGHPTRYLHTVFWDVLNYAEGRNTPVADYRFSPLRSDEAYARSLQNLRRMVLSAAALPDVEIVGLRRIVESFPREPASVEPSELREAARVIAEASVIPPYFVSASGTRLSPAQLADALCRSLSNAPRRSHEPVPVREVLGPPAPPPSLERPLRLSSERLLEVGRALVAAVDRTGALPDRLPVGDTAVGPGAVLRCAAQALARDGYDPASASEPVLTPGAEEPGGAAELAEAAIDRRLPSWPPHPRDLRLDLLNLHTRLQAWSLRPAY